MAVSIQTPPPERIAVGPPQRPGPGGRFFGGLGRRAEALARHAGEIALLIWRVFIALVRGQIPLRDVLGQIYWIGVQSVPIILVTGALAGIVTSQQGGYQFTGSIPLYILGSVVVSSIILELGPVLTAVVLIGRVGARITAEIGTMKVSEQIDALYSVGRDPIKTLVAPRVIASMIAVPALVAIANIVGILSGMLAARATLGLGFESFLYGARLFWHNYDMFYSLSKGLVFGFVIPVIAAHMGMQTRGGAEGVGRATTEAVVAMTLTILIVDALFPPLLLQ
jgi:phospholipid/cholesterol/gamma-HCH transport system permease protein